LRKESKPYPRELETVFEKIKYQVVVLHSRWIIYRQLYGTSKERIELLNESAVEFFWIIQDVLWDEILLNAGLRIRFKAGVIRSPKKTYVWKCFVRL